MAPSLKPRKNKSDTLGARIKKHRSLIPFVVPAIAFAIVFCYLPMVGILIAFKDDPNFAKYGVINAFMRADWTLEHFKVLFSV